MDDAVAMAIVNVAHDEGERVREGLAITDVDNVDLHVEITLFMWTSTTTTVY
jgi:hypothetical protein